MTPIQSSFLHTLATRKIFSIAVDSARVCILARSEGLKGFNRALRNIKGEHRCIELGDLNGPTTIGLVVLMTASTEHGEQIKSGTTWLTQSDEPEDEKLSVQSLTEKIHLVDCCHEMDKRSALTTMR